MTTRSEEEQSYEEMLRAVGAYLDREPHRRFRLIEVPAGFILTLEVGKQKEDVREVHFPRVDLEQQIRQLMRSRRRLGGSRHQGKWHLASTSRQDFLRALGYELDDTEAHEILIDELEDGLVVTYSFLDPTRGYQWRKHMTQLGPEQIESILEAAHARRAKRGLLKL